MNNTATTMRRAPAHTVLIADEQTLLRDALKIIVGRVLDAPKFVEAYDAESLLHVLSQHRDIRLAVIDLKMPGMNGQSLHQIARFHPRLPLVIVSAVSSLQDVQRIVTLPSVHAFVSKFAPADAVQAAVEATLQGKRIPPVVSNHAGGSRRVGLTPRQEDILKLLRQGMSNKTIATTLGISTGTVKNHITGIFKILNTSNRTQAAQLDADS